MASSIKKDVAEGPNFDVTVNFMDNGGVRITLPDGPCFSRATPETLSGRLEGGRPAP